MALHRHPLSRILFLTLVSALVAAQDDQKPFDCHITSGDFQYDLKSLAGEHTVSREVKQPPSTLDDKATFNLCEDLKHKSDVPDDDQCPSGTRACLVRTSRKNGHNDRIISVVPLANSSASAVTYEQLSSPKGLLLTFGGSWYPSSVDAKPVPQNFHLKLVCEPEKDASDVDFISYNGTDLWLEWQTRAGCPFSGPPDDGTKKPDEGGGNKDSGGDKEEERVGSGIGYFFLLMFLAIVAYFALGAYYNYSTYGATGADLIPHRDFWREVPYMLRDLVSHICSAVRPRHSSSRGGYIAV